MTVLIGTAARRTIRLGVFSMSTIQHKAVTGADLHGIVAFSVVSTSSRDALSVAAGDIGKVCQVTADNSFYVLTGASPSVWSPLSPALALSTVATTGSYADLTDKPSIPAAPTWSTLSGAPTLATVATSGSYADLSGAPSLSPVATTGTYADLSNKPTIPAAPTWSTLSGAPTLATVATTGSYDDLTNKPSILAAPTWSTLSGAPALAAVATSGSYADLTNKPTIPAAPTWSTLSGAPTLSTVATSGSYTDLSNTPNIPNAYTLPVASASVLGGVKAGTGVEIDELGVISVVVDAYQLPTASAFVSGGVKIGAGLSIDGTGVVTALPGVSLTAPNTWLAAQRGAVVALTVGAIITLDFTASNNFSLALTQSFTLTNPINVSAGQSGVIAVIQDEVGGRIISWGSSFKAAGGTKPVLTTTAGAVDYISYYVESVTRIFVSIAADIK